MAIHTGSCAGPGVAVGSLPWETGMGWQLKDGKALVNWHRVTRESSRRKKQHVQRQVGADTEAAQCAEPWGREQSGGEMSLEQEAVADYAAPDCVMIFVQTALRSP